jgi:hypothetical protein
MPYRIPIPFQSAELSVSVQNVLMYVHYFSCLLARRSYHFCTSGIKTLFPPDDDGMQTIFELGFTDCKSCLEEIGVATNQMHTV